MSDEPDANAPIGMLPEQCGTAPQPDCTSWPDVGLAIVAFAREDTLSFIVVLGAFGFILWALYPSRSQFLRDAFNAARRGAQQESQNSGDTSHD